MNAKLTSPVSGNLHLQHIELPRLALNVSATGPNLPGKSISGSLSGSASINASKQQVQAHLAGKVADSTIKADIGVNGFTPPALTFDVDVDQLDLDKYAAPGDAKPAGGAGGGADKPIDVTALRNLRASGQLHIGALKVSNLKLSNIRLALKASGGNVAINPLSANLYEGAVNGAVSVNAAPAAPQFAIKQNLSGVAIGPLLKDLANKDTLDGRGNVMLDVRTQGATVSALKHALAGGASVNLRDGAIKGIDIAGTIRDAKAKLGTLGGQQTQPSDKTKKTEFSQLSATFALQNGVAHNEDLDLKSPLLRVGGRG